MFKEEKQFYTKLTYKAKQGARELEQVSLYERKTQPSYRNEINEKDLKYTIIYEKKNHYLDTFLKYLERAVLLTKEYDRLEIFSENIVAIFSTYIMDFLTEMVEFGAYAVYDVMENRGGSMGDFLEGVEYAREMFGVSGKDAARAARYWMVKVWTDADKYEDTIAYRFQAWEDKAPYWYFLEHGNIDHSTAFPKFTRTNFLTTAAYDILGDIETEIAIRKADMQEDVYEEEEINEEYEERKLNLFDRAIIEFENNPDAYPPGTIFGTYKSIEDERLYKVYVTKTGKIGRRLAR